LLGKNIERCSDSGGVRK